MADINIYGTLHAATGDAVIARAAQIEDAALNKKQSVINQELLNGSWTFSVSGETLSIARPAT